MSKDGHVIVGTLQFLHDGERAGPLVTACLGAAPFAIHLGAKRGHERRWIGGVRLCERRFRRPHHDAMDDLRRFDLRGADQRAAQPVRHQCGRLGHGRQRPCVPMTSAAGAVSLPRLSGYTDGSAVYGIDADGSIAVGNSQKSWAAAIGTTRPCGGPRPAARPRSRGRFSPGHNYSTAQAVNADGSVAVGMSWPTGPDLLRLDSAGLAAPCRASATSTRSRSPPMATRCSVPPWTAAVPCAGHRSTASRPYLRFLPLAVRV